MVKHVYCFMIWYDYKAVQMNGNTTIQQQD